MHAGHKAADGGEEFEARVDVAYRAVSQADPRDLFRAGRAAVLAGAVLPAAGIIGLVLTVLTGSWYWLVRLPPAVHGVHRMARKVQGGDQEVRSGRPELR